MIRGETIAAKILLQNFFLHYVTIYGVIDDFVSPALLEVDDTKVLSVKLEVQSVISRDYFFLSKTK